MKKFLASAAIIPVLAFAGAAVAGDFPEQGKISTMNSWSVTLENGMLFQVSDQEALKELKPGDEIKVNYIDHPEYGFIDAKVERAENRQSPQ